MSRMDALAEQENTTRLAFLAQLRKMRACIDLAIVEVEQGRMPSGPQLSHRFVATREARALWGATVRAYTTAERELTKWRGIDAIALDMARVDDA